MMAEVLYLYRIQRASTNLLLLKTVVGCLLARELALQFRPSMICGPLNAISGRDHGLFNRSHCF
jgi:hypothetical protein